MLGESFHFVDQNKNTARYLKNYLKFASVINHVN